MVREFPGGRRLRLVVGDITRVSADAIVNAAIHRVGGPSLMRELDQIRASAGGCPTGGAVATGAGNLPARFVFHAVGPIYRDGRHGEPEALASCYTTCLAMAEERGVRVIGFPSISTGAYGYPLDEAAPIALAACAAHLEREDARVEEIVFVLFDRATYDAYARALA
jgi:O-acetyl-ADP-ribose deacetylase (regulator of RNase III)